ncbi:MAG: hypothetical protein HYT09_02830 [Candidatus Levybacteria bacterium]|nr:hypothetical protein [Candidatus Levybacteria bacterium]
MGTVEAWRLISTLHKATPEEIAAAYQEIAQFPYGELIASAFQKHVREDGLMIGDGVIVGEVADEGIVASMRLKAPTRGTEHAIHDSVSLHVYGGPMSKIPESPFSVVGALDSIAFIRAGTTEAMSWAYGRGNLRKWTLYASLGESRGLYLPSKTGKWALRFLADFAEQASEFYDPLSEQPDFWDGEDLESP